MSGKTAMIPLFLNLLSLIAPTLWVLASGALGIGIGAYGPRLVARFKPPALKPRFAAKPKSAAARTKRKRQAS